MAKNKSTTSKKNLKPATGKSSGSRGKSSSASSHKKKAVASKSSGTKTAKAKAVASTAVKKTNNKKAPAKNKPASTRDKAILEIRTSLQTQKETLLSGAEEALNELPGQTVFPDMGDQASAETDRNFMLRLRGREQRLLKKIDEALDRIENSNYGICEDCGEEIDIKRLQARPVTTMCIDCKTLQEEEEKLREA